MNILSVDYNDKNYDYTKYWQGRNYENESEFIALKKLLPKDFGENKSVIDIGGGFGRLLPIFKTRFGSITIFDYSQKLLDTADENAKKLNLSIRTVKGDIYLISNLVSEKFDCVSMVRVSHHLDDLEKVFLEVNKILNEDGIFIFEVANKIHFKSVLTNIFRGNFGYFNKKSISVATKDVTFLNHHPKNVENLLDKAGFKIEKKLSVSNLRMPFVKRLFPVSFMLFFENITQGFLAPFYFGPSIFYRVVKKKD